MEEDLAAYRAWRAALSADDQTRWMYLLADGEPLLVDVIKAFVDPSVRTLPLGSVAEAGLNAVIDGAGRDALKALQEP